MRHLLPLLLMIAAPALAAEEMQVTLKGIRQGSWLADKYALCNPDDKIHTKNGRNISPEIRWSSVAGAQSYAIVMHDTDVPEDFSDANKEDVMISAGASRREAYYHWLVSNIPASIRSLREGKVKYPQGKNDLGNVRYDGPCPPWNDEKLHNYHFTVYALDIPKLDLPPEFSAPEMLATMKDHILAKGSVSVVYNQMLGSLK